MRVEAGPGAVGHKGHPPVAAGGAHDVHPSEGLLRDELDHFVHVVGHAAGLDPVVAGTDGDDGKPELAGVRTRGLAPAADATQHFVQGTVAAHGCDAAVARGGGFPRELLGVSLMVGEGRYEGDALLFQQLLGGDPLRHRLAGTRPRIDDEIPLGFCFRHTANIGIIC